MASADATSKDENGRKKNLVSVRPYFYIYAIFAGKRKRDEKFRKRDRKWVKGSRKWDGIQERVYPARFTGRDGSAFIPFSNYTGWAK